MVLAGSAVVSGLQLGNVWIGVQPALGVEGDPMRLLFDRSHSPVPAGPFLATPANLLHMQTVPDKGIMPVSSVTGPALLFLLLTHLLNLQQEAPLRLGGWQIPSSCGLLAHPHYILSDMDFLHMDRPAECPACCHERP